MAEAIVREWLSEYKALSEEHVYSFSNTICQHNELIQALFTILEEKKYHQEFLEPVCHQLFSFYQAREDGLRQFALHYVPVLIALYLCSVAKGEKKNFGCIEVLLLGIYNVEVTDFEGSAKFHTFRIPSVLKPSIYHEPTTLSQSVLTEHALSKLEHVDVPTVTTGPHLHVEKIIAGNRLQVMTVLLHVYNQHIGFLSKPAHLYLCKMASKVSKQGFTKSAVEQRLSFTNEGSYYGNPRPLPRIPLSSSILLEIVHAVYFSMFNGWSSPGLQALDDIHYRASVELYADVLLVTQAIRNSLKFNPSGQPNDGPMGISIALSPTTNTTTVSKAIITNASFRTKKLPDDIPIQTQDADASGNDGQQLPSIAEEGEDVDRSVHPSSSLSKKRGGSISGASSNIAGLAKLPLLQLRKDKGKGKKDSKEPALHDGNGTVKSRRDSDGGTRTAAKNLVPDDGLERDPTFSDESESLATSEAECLSLDTMSLTDTKTSISPLEMETMDVSIISRQRKTSVDSIPSNYEMKILQDSSANPISKYCITSEAEELLNNHTGVEGFYLDSDKKLSLQSAGQQKEMETRSTRQVPLQTIV